MIRFIAVAAFTIGIAVAGTASAEPFRPKGATSPTPEIRGDLTTAPPPFVLFVKRPGGACPAPRRGSRVEARE